MPIRYSIIMPYYSRPEIRFSLSSFQAFYKDRNDIEIIIVEDSKNFYDETKHKKLLEIIEQFNNMLYIKLILDPLMSYNCSNKYNLGVKNSEGSIIMLTNPETPHTMNILNELDMVNFSNTYIVCACSAVFLKEDKGTFTDSKFDFYYWYQHTRLGNNFKYHFCSAISKDNYNRCKGFDERFCGGIAYEDANFVQRVLKKDIVIEPRDDLLVYHIEHSRDYSLDKEQTDKLIQINSSIWHRQISTGDY
jgi:hypothetical protein